MAMWNYQMVTCRYIPGIVSGLQAIYTLGNTTNLTGTFHMVVTDLPFLGPGMHPDVHFLTGTINSFVGK